MRICTISRPPLKEITKKFGVRRHHILKRMNLMGHEVESFVVHPVHLPNMYLAYGLGIAISPFRFPRRRPELLLADDLESGMAAALIKSVFKIPFVFDFIDDYSLIASYEGRMVRYHALRLLERTIPKLADGVIAETPKIREFCLDLGIPEQRLKVVPNGVDTKQFRPAIDDNVMRRKLNLKDNRVILFLGKINKYYNLEVILRAVPFVLKSFPDTKFLFVGDGDYLDHLKRLSHELKAEAAVMFTGFVAPDDIPKIINLSDICVFPLPDDGALAIFEYMACAKPVVLPRGGTKKMGISRTIIPDDCALAVDGSPEEFAQGINSLLNNEERAQEMGSKARERVVAFHDWDRLAKAYERTLQKVLPSS